MKILKAISIIGLVALLNACVPVEEPVKEKETLGTETKSKSDIEEVVVTEEEKDFEYYMSCENNKFSFMVDQIGGGHGQSVFTGTIEKDLEDYSWDPEEENLIPTISLLVEESDSNEALEHYKTMSKNGNTINRFKGEKLRFKLGIMENDEFSTTATISDETVSSIFDAQESGEEISLLLTHPFQPGMGAPDNFSFACEIELAD